jgi:formylglycine-generating enzyme required for sulfatase activity
LTQIPGGSFIMGDKEGDANEAPRRVSVGAFRIMRQEVTNAEFAEFVAATGHVTDIERNAEGHIWTGRWRRVARADWRHPHDPDDSKEARKDHPVVQISARAAAARGTDGRRYPWGFEPPRQSAPFRANFGTKTCCGAEDRGLLA